MTPLILLAAILAAVTLRTGSPLAGFALSFVLLACALAVSPYPEDENDEQTP